MAEDILASERFDNLDGERGSVTDRAELCAELTIPYIFTEDGSTDADDLSREYVQGYGAKLVNHLTGKFALAILPPSQPFFRLSGTQEAMEAITEGDADTRYEIEKILAVKEEGILRYINKSRFRASLYPALRLAMITGDALIQKLDDDKFRVLNMKNYVVERDSAGTIIHIVIRENLKYETVPEDIRSKIKDEDKDGEIFLYTNVSLVDGKYEIFQEVKDEKISGSEKTLSVLSDMFISVRWNKMDGENYGRSFVEEHLGTLISLNKQMLVVNQTAAVGSKTVFMLNPNGMTKYSDYVDAENGEVIIGHESDVGISKVDKGSDLVPSMQLIQDYKRELAEAFLLGSSAVRDSERTTKYEVQLTASELEASFGGIYTALAEDIQVPLVENGMKSLKIEGGDEVDVIITAGVEALGRNVELTKINTLLEELTMLGSMLNSNPEVAKITNVQSFASAMVVNSGVAGKEFLLAPAVTNQNEKNQKQEAIAQEVVKGGLTQAGQNLANQEVPAQQ